LRQVPGAASTVAPSLSPADRTAPVRVAMVPAANPRSTLTRVSRVVLNRLTRSSNRSPSMSLLNPSTRCGCGAPPVAFASASVPRIWHRHTHGCDARVPAPASSTQEVRKSIRQMACISVRRKECRPEFLLEMRLRHAGATREGSSITTPDAPRGNWASDGAARQGVRGVRGTLLLAPACLLCPDVADCECVQGICTEITPICPATCSAGDRNCPGEDCVCLGIGELEQPTCGLCIPDNQPAINAGECCSGDFCSKNGLCGLCPPAPEEEVSTRLQRARADSL